MSGADTAAPGRVEQPAPPVEIAVGGVIPQGIPIPGSSVPWGGPGCAECQALSYARRLELRWHQDQRTILDLRAEVAALREQLEGCADAGPRREARAA